MATFDLTSSATTGVNSNSIAALPGHLQRANVYGVEKIIDIAKFVEAGYSFTSGDVFQALEIPANSMVIAAGAEVMTAFDGTSPVADIDFAEGDDIIDGGDLSSTGWLAQGTNGTAMTTAGDATNGVMAYTQLVTTTDTIDVVLSAGANDITEGVLRVFAVVADVGVIGGYVPTEVVRDQLA